MLTRFRFHAPSRLRIDRNEPVPAARLAGSWAFADGAGNEWQCALAAAGVAWLAWGIQPHVLVAGFQPIHGA